MTLNELRYVVAVDREKHFGRAADQCFVSQPTLSVAVKKLEGELGIQLFERYPTEVVTTPAGARVIEQAQRTLEEAERVKSIARAGQNQLAGELRLGAIFTIGPYLLPHVIPRLRKLAPEMPLVIEENYTAVLRERLKRGEVDVIIISLPFTESGVITQAMYDEPFTVLLPVNHPLAKHKTIKSADLTDENLLLLGAGHCFRDQVLQACPECAGDSADGKRGSLQNSIEGSSLETIRQMVASGLGVTVLPLTSATAGSQSQNELLAERPFATRKGQLVPTRTVALAWRKRFPRPQAVEALQQAIHESALPNIRYR